jgi:hypothetical protein
VRARVRIAAAAAAVASLAAVPASALAALDVAVQPSEARYGQSHHVTGRLTDAAGAGLGGRRIALEKRDFPYKGVFRPISHATTAADGSFGFDDVRLARNADLRVVAFDGTTSGIARAWTYPAFTLRYKPVAANRIEVTQTYTTPRSVRLKAPTFFFLSKATAKSSSMRVKVKTKRTAAGRFAATTTIQLPKSWKGHFRYASCFGYTKNSGMGDPARGCPARFTF